jgi:ribosomal protein S18 acetylase RimI-like enzyme
VKEASSVIRPAEREDADFLAWVILTAARSQLDKGWFDIMLNRPESACLDYLRRLTLAPVQSWWHYSRFHVAELDGSPAAALCAFRGGEAYALSLPAMAKVASELGLGDAERHEMRRRGVYLSTCTLETEEDAWTIENVATLPRYRRRGLATSLIQHALAEGQRDGARRTQITFIIGNDAAERAYAKAGFRFDAEKRHPDFETATGVPGLRRYARKI